MSGVSRSAAVLGSDDWRRALRRWAPRIATWLLAAAIAIQATFIVKRLARIGRSTPAPVARTDLSPGAHFDVTATVRAHLFGAAPAPVRVDAANGPSAPVPLALYGILAAKDPKDGLAIVASAGAAEKLYAVGDTMPGEAHLHAVYQDRIVVERGGAVRVLTLPRASLRGASHMLMAKTVPASSVNTQSMEELLQTRPTYAYGHLKGFRVYPGANEDAFAMTGLDPADLIVAIDGTPLNDAADIGAVVRTLASAGSTNVTVMRRGRRQDLTVDLSKLAALAP